MKLVFSFCLWFLSLPSFAHTVLIGTGSGAVLQNDMNGLHPGDTLAIRPGRYENGGSLTHLQGITIINFRGLVEFGNTVFLGNLKNVSISGTGSANTLYGIRFINCAGNAFELNGCSQLLSIAFCEYRNVKGTAFSASHFFTTYTGADSTMALYKTRIVRQKLVHSGALFVGSWAANATFQNVVDSIALLDILVDSTVSDVCQVLGQSIYRMLASRWRVTGPCPNGKHDAGIFQISGNGTVSNVYRKDGWGYLWRIWNVGLNGRAESYLFNCIDLNTDNYGTIDTRVEAGDTTTGNRIPFCRGGNMHVLNNTIGNKRTINYVSELVIAGNFCSTSGYQLEVRNNLCFNTVATGADRVIKQNTGDPLRDTSNNLYSSNPIADGLLLDTIQCMLNPRGGAIDAARSFPFIPADIDGIHRPAGKSDIGAREYESRDLTPLSHSGAFSGVSMIIALIACLALSGFYVYRRKGRRKSRLSFQIYPLHNG